MIASTLIYLDAFGSVEHSLIYHTLGKCLVPKILIFYIKKCIPIWRAPCQAHGVTLSQSRLDGAFFRAPLAPNYMFNCVQLKINQRSMDMYITYFVKTCGVNRNVLETG